MPPSRREEIEAKRQKLQALRRQRLEREAKERESGEKPGETHQKSDIHETEYQQNSNQQTGEIYQSKEDGNDKISPLLSSPNRQIDLKKSRGSKFRAVSSPNVDQLVTNLIQSPKSRSRREASLGSKSFVASNMGKVEYKDVGIEVSSSSFASGGGGADFGGGNSAVGAGAGASGASISASIPASSPSTSKIIYHKYIETVPLTTSASPSSPPPAVPPSPSLLEKMHSIEAQNLLLQEKLNSTAQHKQLTVDHVLQRLAETEDHPANLLDLKKHVLRSLAAQEASRSRDEDLIFRTTIEEAFDIAVARRAAAAVNAGSSDPEKSQEQQQCYEAGNLTVTRLRNWSRLPVEEDAQRPVTAIAVSANSEFCAVSYAMLSHQKDRAAVYLWNLASSSASLPHRILTCSTDIMCLTFHPTDPSILYGGGYNGKVYTWNSREHDAAISVTAQHHLYPIFSILFDSSAGASRVVSCSTDGTVVTWASHSVTVPVAKVKLKSASSALESKYDEISPLCMANSHSSLIFGCEDGDIYDSESAIYSSLSAAPVSSVDCVEGFILCAGFDWTIKVLKHQPGSMATPILSLSRSDIVMDAKWRSKSQFVAVGGSGNIEVWDLKSSTKAPVVEIAGSVALTKVGVSNDGKYVVVGGVDGVVGVYEFAEKSGSVE